jgi:hypothetical protein
MSITRRLWTSFRDRDWGMAIVDVGIVAIGILMALGVDEWRTERDAKTAEQQILRRMHVEMVGAINAFYERQERRVERLGNLYDARRLVFSIPPSHDLSDEQCDELFYSSRLAFPEVKIPIIDELAASGTLSIVQDDELRSSILELVDQQAGAASRAAMWSNQMHDLALLFPDLIQAGLKREDDPSDTDGFDLMLTCDLDGMRGSSQFGNALARNVANTIDVVESITRLIQPKLEQAHAQLDAKLSLAH